MSATAVQVNQDRPHTVAARTGRFEVVGGRQAWGRDDVHAPWQQSIGFVDLFGVRLGSLSRLSRSALGFGVAFVGSVALLGNYCIGPLGDAELEADFQRRTSGKSVGLAQRGDGHVVA